MTKFFQQFQYQLNINYQNHGNQLTQKHKNSIKIISILITPSTNIQCQARKVCIENKIDINIIDPLIKSIKQEIQKQIQNSQDIGYLIQKKNKPTKFKNKFCQYLKQINGKQELHINQTFRNEYPGIDFQSQDNLEEQYSFRPATFLRILNLEDSQKNQQTKISQNYQDQMNQFGIFSQVQMNQKSKNEKQGTRKVFENLYNSYGIIQYRKQMKRKKSFEKFSFKPQINKNSKKIVEIKRQLNNELSPIWKKKSVSKQKKNVKQNQVNKQVWRQQATKRKSSAHKCKSNLCKQPLKDCYQESSQYKNILKNIEKKSLNSNSKQICSGKGTQSNNVLGIEKIENGSLNSTMRSRFTQGRCLESNDQKSIYERGQQFIKRSKEKLNKLKQNQIRQQMKQCTFKPKLTSKCSSISIPPSKLYH